MNQDPSKTSGNRVTQGIAVLLATTALVACNNSEVTQGKVGPEVAAVATEPDNNMSLEETAAHTEHEAYFSDTERNMRIRGEVATLAYKAAELTRGSDRFTTTWNETDDGGISVTMSGLNEQGDKLLITASGEASDSDTRFQIGEGMVAIIPTDFSISVVPKGVPDFYNFSADVGFSQDESGNYITTLRTDVDVQNNKSRYYTVHENHVNQTVVDPRNPSSIKGGEEPSVETAELVDEYAFDRAHSLIDTIDRPGGEGAIIVYHYGDPVDVELSRRSVEEEVVVPVTSAPERENDIQELDNTIDRAPTGQPGHGTVRDQSPTPALPEPAVPGELNEGQPGPGPSSD